MIVENYLMKRLLLTSLLFSFVCCMNIQAQNNFGNNRNNRNTYNNGRDAYGNQIDPNMQPDSFTNDSTEIESAPPKLYQWRVSENLGNRIMSPVDTVALNFQNMNMEEGMTGHYSILGNMGSPRLSHIWADRQYDTAPTMFLEPLTGFYKRSDQMVFTNSNIPYTNLSYWPNGNKITGEDRFKAYFSMNVNRRFAFGFNFDYQYGRGYYANQATSNFNAALFASYMGKHYQMHAAYNNFYFKQNENGGIMDDEYITKALQLGAKGYIIKQDYETIVPALNAVYSGQNVYGSEIMEKLPELMKPEPSFDYSSHDITEKEYEIITLVAQGLSNKEISARLFLSEGTIRNYLSGILEKLQLRDRTQLAVFYYQHS